MNLQTREDQPSNLVSSTRQSMQAQQSYLNQVRAKRELAQIICEPDHQGVLAYALGFVCSDLYINEHDLRFSSKGKGLLVNDSLAVTRLMDLADLADGLDPSTIPSLDKHEIWVVERPRGFGQAGAAVAISGDAWRELLAQARPLWRTLKRDFQAARAKKLESL
jgi:hypothetical protein